MGQKLIPNEARYRLQIPTKTIYDFLGRGEGQYEETLEDHFVYCITLPLIRNCVEFEIQYDAFEVKDCFGIELRVNGHNFDENSIVQNLSEEGLISGLILTKSFYNTWIEIYNDQELKK